MFGAGEDFDDGVHLLSVEFHFHEACQSTTETQQGAQLDPLDGGEELFGLSCLGFELAHLIQQLFAHLVNRRGGAAAGLVSLV